MLCPPCRALPWNNSLILFNSLRPSYHISQFTLDSVFRLEAIDDGKPGDDTNGDYLAIQFVVGIVVVNVDTGGHGTGFPVAVFVQVTVTCAG